jgi:hypothetical protein
VYFGYRDKKVVGVFDFRAPLHRKAWLTTAAQLTRGMPAHRRGIYLDLRTCTLGHVVDAHWREFMDAEDPEVIGLSLCCPIGCTVPQPQTSLFIEPVNPMELLYSNTTKQSTSHV